MSITGLPGQGPVRVGIPVADLTAGIFCAMGILVALLERERSGKGQWVQSNLLAAQIAMLDFQAARWTIGQRGAGPGRQRPSDQHPHRRVPDIGWLHEHRRRGRGDLSAVLQGDRRAELANDPDFATNADRSKNRTRLQRRNQRDHAQADNARVDRSAQPGRRAVRADLPDERDVRRPAGPATSTSRAMCSTRCWAMWRSWVRRSSCRARRGVCEAHHRSPANTPTRCWANWVMARRTSPDCASRR